MSIIVPADTLSSVTLNYGATQYQTDLKISHVLEQWWALEADGWVKRGAYDLTLLLTYWRKNPNHPEARRLVECLSFISNIRAAMPNGIDDANSERMFDAFLKLILRPKSSGVFRSRYDHLLEFCDQLSTPVLIETFDKSFGEYANKHIDAILYNGRPSIGVTAHQLFIPELADILVQKNREVMKAGQSIVTNEEAPGEHWQNLRIPCADERGRMRTVLVSRCVFTKGSDNSWMFNNPPPGM